MSKVVKTTKRDFELFKSECEKWIQELGLYEYEYSFYHEDIGENRADFLYQHTSKMITIRLNTQISERRYGEEKIKRSAFHEVFESMLLKLQVICESRDDKNEIEAERHALVHRLYRILTRQIIFKDGEFIKKKDYYKGGDRL